MGLRDSFRGVARSVLAAFGDVPESVSYRAHVSTSVNASTGTASTIYSTVAAVPMVAARFHSKEIDGQVVRSTDMRGLIAAVDMPSVAPTASDRVVRPDGVAWSVIGVKTDPAEALWQLHLRRA